VFVNYRFEHRRRIDRSVVLRPADRFVPWATNATRRRDSAVASLVVAGGELWRSRFTAPTLPSVPIRFGRQLAAPYSCYCP
jgi:hypothetical protein